MENPNKIKTQEIQNLTLNFGLKIYTNSRTNNTPTIKTYVIKLIA